MTQSLADGVDQLVSPGAAGNSLSSPSDVGDLTAQPAPQQVGDIARFGRVRVDQLRSPPRVTPGVLAGVDEPAVSHQPTMSDRRETAEKRTDLEADVGWSSVS